jgi:hypothetical protein
MAVDCLLQGESEFTTRDTKRKPQPKEYSPQRRRDTEKTKSNRRAQRWQRPQRRAILWGISVSVGFGSRESSQFAKILAVSSTETRRKQSQNRRAQRWQRPQRRDPLGDQRLSALGSRASSRRSQRRKDPPVSASQRLRSARVVAAGSAAVSAVAPKALWRRLQPGLESAPRSCYLRFFTAGPQLPGAATVNINGGEVTPPMLTVSG